MLPTQFFNRDAQLVARELLGKVLYHRYDGIWLSAQIIETEAYYIHEKGSHSSLGLTPSRRALFMPAGTIYMYYARGGDSLNVSVHGDGNAVLIKSGYPYFDQDTHPQMLETMQRLNPKRDGSIRSIEKLCAGQTLLCKSLGIKVVKYNRQQFDLENLVIADKGYKPTEVLQTPRKGIPPGRDEHLPYRFVDANYTKFASK